MPYDTTRGEPCVICGRRERKPVGRTDGWGWFALDADGDKRCPACINKSLAAVLLGKMNKKRNRDANGKFIKKGKQ